MRYEDVPDKLPISVVVPRQGTHCSRVKRFFDRSDSDFVIAKLVAASSLPLIGYHDGVRAEGTDCFVHIQGGGGWISDTVPHYNYPDGARTKTSKEKFDVTDWFFCKLEDLCLPEDIMGKWDKRAKVESGRVRVWI